jgi:molecular chaperone HscB
VTQSYFELFGLETKFNIDLAILESNYRKIQSESHPDRFVTASATEKLKSMQTATLANVAYQALKQPALRAAYLLGLQGISAITETSTAMPVDFLMQQMEWREAIEDNATNLSGMHRLLRNIKQETTTLQQTLADELDVQQAWQAAAETLRKLQFMDKLREEIARKLEILED